MHLVATGLNYLSAPLDVRERVAIGSHELETAHAQLKHSVREGLIVSTCNRTEVYAVVDERADLGPLIAFLARRGDIETHDLRDCTYVLEGRDAARHAFRVASGLESMVLGEDQIQSQVKRALATSRAVHGLGPVLERLGTTALACGKRVRTFTGVGRHAVSLESLAVRTAATRVGGLEPHTIVVIGAGESAALVARHLRHSGASRDRITIVSRSTDRSAALAAAADAHAGSLADLADLLASADIAFACTSAPHPVLTPDFLAHRSAMRPGAPLLCVDLGMPRDVHPDVASVPDISVVTLDELATIAEAHRAARRSDIPAAEAIVEGEVERFLAWMRSRSSVRDVAALDSRARSVAEQELARALARLPGLDARARSVVSELAHRIARKLTHEPIQQLKEQTGRERIALG